MPKPPKKWNEPESKSIDLPVEEVEELKVEEEEPGIEEVGSFIPKLKKKALNALRSKGYENAAKVVDMLTPDDVKDVALGVIGGSLAAKLGKLAKGSKIGSKADDVVEDGLELVDDLEFPSTSSMRTMEETVGRKIPEMPRAKTPEPKLPSKAEKREINKFFKDMEKKGPGEQLYRLRDDK